MNIRKYLRKLEKENDEMMDKYHNLEKKCQNNKKISEALSYFVTDHPEFLNMTFDIEKCTNLLFLTSLNYRLTINAVAENGVIHYDLREKQYPVNDIEKETNSLTVSTIKKYLRVITDDIKNDTSEAKVLKIEMSRNRYLINALTIFLKSKPEFLDEDFVFDVFSDTILMENNRYNVVISMLDNIGKIYRWNIIEKE